MSQSITIALLAAILWAIRRLEQQQRPETPMATVINMLTGEPVETEVQDAVELEDSCGQANPFVEAEQDRVIEEVDPAVFDLTPDGVIEEHYMGKIPTNEDYRDKTRPIGADPYKPDPPAPTDETDPLECPFCGKVFASENGVKIHIGRSHKKRTAMEETECCGEVFDDSGKYRRHQRMAHGIRG